MINYEKAYIAMRKDIEKAINQLQKGQINEAEARLQFSLIKTGEMYDLCMNNDSETGYNSKT